jgi:hypothetical protein
MKVKMLLSNNLLVKEMMNHQREPVKVVMGMSEVMKNNN